MKTILRILGYTLLIYWVAQYFANTKHINTTDKDYIIDLPELNYDPAKLDEQRSIDTHHLRKIPKSKLTTTDNDNDEPPDDNSPDY